MKGRVALVTGAARGQGASHGEFLAKEGADVVLADVLDSEGEAEAARQRKDGLAVEYMHLDVSSPEEWTAAVRHIEEKFDRLDVLVNNAGIGQYAGVVDCSDEEWARTIAVNQSGVFYGMRAVIPTMRVRGGGSIINTASIFGLNGAADYIAYVASKAAVIGMTKSAALSYGEDNIRVNAICPGVVDTPMLAEELETMTEAGLNEMLAIQPIHRRGVPEDISKGVVYLASDDSSYVTGTTLVIDGGFAAQ
jgi:3alpha(or 20beta)-hydroxysteroid dehydrogenase